MLTPAKLLDPPKTTDPTTAHLQAEKAQENNFEYASSSERQTEYGVKIEE